MSADRLRCFENLDGPFLDLPKTRKGWKGALRRAEGILCGLNLLTSWLTSVEGGSTRNLVLILKRALVTE